MKLKSLHALVLGLSLAAPLSVFAFGSIAVDDEVGDDEPGYGIAVGEDTKEAAQKAAVKYCKEHGNSNCKSVVWFKQCGAYAASKKYYGYGYGATKAIASRKALDMCAHESCKVAVAECED